MARYTVTKNYAEITEEYGVLQNLTGDANIEITNDISQAGIILKPFKTLMLSQKIYARKVGNVGTSVLAVMPYKNKKIRIKRENLLKYQKSFGIIKTPKIKYRRKFCN